MVFRAEHLLRSECGTGNTTVVVGAGEQHMFGVCWWAKQMPDDNNVNGKVIRVDSSQPISVIGLNKVRSIACDQNLI